MTATYWRAILGRVAIATLCFATVATLMVGDQIAQPSTAHVPAIQWSLERP